MGKPTNGPDVTDIAMMMSAMESLHECRVECAVTAGTQGHNGSLHIRLTAIFPTLTNSAGQILVTADSDYPCKACSDLNTHVFKGLYALDAAIQRQYEQEALPIS